MGIRDMGVFIKLFAIEWVKVLSVPWVTAANFGFFRYLSRLKGVNFSGTYKQFLVLKNLGSPEHL